MSGLLGSGGFSGLFGNAGLSSPGSLDRAGFWGPSGFWGPIDGSFSGTSSSKTCSSTKANLGRSYQQYELVRMLNASVFGEGQLTHRGPVSTKASGWGHAGL